MKKNYSRIGMQVVTASHCISSRTARWVLSILLLSLVMTKFVQAQSSGDLTIAAADGGSSGVGDVSQAESTPPVGNAAVPFGQGQNVGGVPAPDELTADQAAKQLANPNTPLASLTLRNQYRWYKGTLPGAEDQNNYTMLFQPVFPFPLNDVDTIFFRPAIPLLVEQPIFKNSGKFGDKTGLGDIAFDLAWGRTEKSGLLLAGGLVSTLPTATSNKLAGKHWTLGPEVFVGLFKSWGVLGVFPNHQWDVAGWGEGRVSTTQLQAFFQWLPGDGWALGPNPIAQYNWVSGEWTIPIQMQVSKTIKIGSTPWKFQFEVNHYVQRPDAFGPKWMIGFNVTPVVKNVIAEWFK